MPDPEARQRAGGWGPFLWLIAIAFALLFGGFLLWDQQAQRGSLEAEYSTYRTDAIGCKALYLTLGALGYRTEQLQTDYAALPPRGLLFVIAPPETRRFGESGDVLPYEIKALDDWVRRGNTVVVMSARRNALYEALGLFPSTPRKPSAALAQPGRLTGGVKDLALTAGRSLRFGQEPTERQSLETGPEEAEKPPVPAIPAQEWVTLVGTPSDPVVAVAARGLGQYIAVADPHVATNLGLAQASNLRFMANLAALAGGTGGGGPGTVVFDEAHHRELGRGFMAYARARRMTPLLLTMLLLAGLAVWRGSVRFGVPLPLLTGEHRDSAEYVRAVAALYQTAGMGRDSVVAAYEQFRRRAASTLGLGRSWNLEVVAARVEARTGRAASEVWQALSDVEAALQQSHLSTPDAFTIVERLATLERELAAGAHSARGARRG